MCLRDAFKIDVEKGSDTASNHVHRAVEIVCFLAVQKLHRKVTLCFPEITAYSSFTEIVVDVRKSAADRAAIILNSPGSNFQPLETGSKN